MIIRSRRSALFFSALVAFFLPGVLLAQAPAEVQNVVFSNGTTVGWDTVTGADTYNVYRQGIADMGSGLLPRCHGFGLAGQTFSTPDIPVDGEAFAYLVTAESATGGEGPAGTGTGGPRTLLGACTPVMHGHVLNRTGNGWSEWARDRIQLLGIQGYIDEQLAPATIDESTNVELNTLLSAYDPPPTIFELLGRHNAYGVYARRQLEHAVASFWENHFNTFWNKIAQIFFSLYPQCPTSPPAPPCDPNYPQLAYLEASRAQRVEFEKFRDLAFNGNFRQMAEASALSTAMILFLDSYANINLFPNENYARELLELYTMGVDTGYTQTDVEELARVLTGWTICRKTPANQADPAAACIDPFYSPVAGEWVAHMDFSEVRAGVPRHDCTAKTMFFGTPHQINFPATPCLSNTEGVTEFNTALDAIITHPSTPQFISKKILQFFVTDNPPQTLIDALVLVWNNAANPHGVGDMLEVTRAALQMAEFMSPDSVGTKIRTPYEQFMTAMRSTRGTTDGISQIINYQAFAGHIPFFNDIPTGYSELGSDWLDTNSTLQRQNFSIHLSAVSGLAFGSDPIGLLNANGVSTGPGNADAIVDFLIDTLFGGALAPSERQVALDYLNTDELGVPGPYNDGRIRETVGLLLGFAQFQEQ